MTTKLEQAARQALDALHNTGNALMCLTATRKLRPMYVEMRDDAVNGANKAITALREALEQNKPHEECECSACLNYFTDKAHEEALAEQAEPDCGGAQHHRYCGSFGD